MTTKIVTILGIDVSKSSITTCILTQYPKGGLQGYWQKTRNSQSKNYPVFYASPKKGQKSAFDFAKYCEEHQITHAVIEPTGNHYSRLWSRIIQSLGIKVLWIGHIELRRYRESKHLPNKSDAADALAMAAYPVDEEHLTEDGEFNQKRYLIEQGETIGKIRELVQQMEHLNRVQSPIINHTRQLLAWQFPEKANSKTRTSSNGNIPPLWGWLAGRENECYPATVAKLKVSYSESIAHTVNLEIEPIVKLQAGWLCDLELAEQRLEQALTALIDEEQFQKYNEVFKEFGFGIKIRARLLSRIYPLESFLVDGHQLIQREVREVKRKEITWENKERVVKFEQGDTKRIKRNRSRDAFKLRLGMGTRLEQSGDKLVEKSSGSALCRKTLWQYVRTSIETENFPDTPICKKIYDCYTTLKSQTDKQGKTLLSTRQIEGKVMSKVINLLYRELVKAIAATK